MCFISFTGLLEEWAKHMDSHAVLKQPLKKQTYEDASGRKWMVPALRSLRSLDREAPVFSLQGLGVDTSNENQVGVLYRYAEYCITAPLLFLAVVCLLVVDAPAWLFLTSYWLLFTCNCVGITFLFNNSPQQ